MIRQVEALRYLCLRFIRQSLTPFQVLVGPNASGKSTFLDVLAFLADMVREKEGVSGAVALRAAHVRDLTWMGQGDSFELTVEAAIPTRLQRGNGAHDAVRYEVRVGAMPVTDEIGLLAENLWLIPSPSVTSDAPSSRQKALFPMPAPPPGSVSHLPRKRSPAGWRLVLRKIPDSGNDYFRSETSRWSNLFRLGPRRSALANLPEDEQKFPISIWFRRLLLDGVQRLALNSAALRSASPPGRPRRFLPDGSNLPWVVHDLEGHAPAQLSDWVAHIRTVLPDLRSISTKEREEDRHRYLELEYDSGLKVPAWLVSEGTLRMLALTILAYIPDLEGVYLIEEPENGIHPRAIEAVYQSLSSVYGAQMLLATHSPVILSLAHPEQVLCFGMDAGATDIVRGSEHPRLRGWRGETDLGTLLASGVLG